MSGARVAGASQVALLYLLALASGAAALAYEVVWTRELSLTLGSSTLALAAATAAFMGGMGFGAWSSHHVLRRVRDPLLLYAAVEVAIAVCALALTAGLAGLPGAFARLAGGLAPGAATTALRLATTFVLLLVPTALMGATFPLLCAAAVDGRRDLDRHLGALYGWNTVGAALGALAAGIVAIPALGLHATVGIAVCVNVAVGALAFGAARRGRSAAPGAEAAADDPYGRGEGSSLPRFALGALLVLGGYTTLANEIVWFRVFRSVAGNSTHAFTITLAAFLLGLGFGSLGLHGALRRARADVALALAHLGTAFWMVVALAAAAALVVTATWTVSSPSFLALAWPLRLAIHAALGLLLALPATLCMGLSFPLATRLFVGAPDGAAEVGRRVGAAVLLANLGAIAGAISAAVWLLPVLGSIGAARVLVGVDALVGVGLLLAARVPLWRTAAAAAVAAAALAFALGVLPNPLRPPGSLMAGLADREIFHEEADHGSTSVVEAVNEPRFRAMAIDGTTIGVSAGWYFPIYSKQIVLAHLPMWIEPRIRSAVQIGLGSSSTLDALASYPELERIAAVEISGAVVRGSHLFEESRAQADPRVAVVVDDALSYLLRMREQVDLIVSDGKQNDDFSANYKMMSREFYRLARDRLSERGLFVQWLSILNHPDDYEIMLRTAVGVFPHVAMFYEPPQAGILVGSRTPIDGRTPMGAEAMARRRAAADLARVDIAPPQLLRFDWIADGVALREVLGRGPINEWDHARLEFSAYRRASGARIDRERARRGRNLDLLLRANTLAQGRAPSGYLPTSPVRREALRRVRLAYRDLMDGDRASAERQVARAFALRPRDPIVLRARRRIAGAAGSDAARTAGGSGGAASSPAGVPTSKGRRSAR